MGVCNKNIIQVEPLPEKEAWFLFQKELGSYNNELEPLAKAVARECAGLPLGLKTMARSMREVDDKREWRNALKDLQQAEKREDDMEPEVFRVLRYSYDRLNDLTIQECFLYCALFPEDFEIQREELIEYLIVEGIIEGKKRWQLHDKGHVILNKLENVCLLESYIDYNKSLLEDCADRNEIRYVKMHDLIRDIVIQKFRERYSIMVEAGAQLREVPDEDEWNESLMRVSLMRNYIQEIPSNHSPRCPKLSTLLLRSNRELRLIADSFFKQLHALKVLDLSNTGIVKLPDSISELVCLVALLFSHCSNLKYLPPLARLTKLQKLDLSETGLEKLPEGMKLLSNLRYLNLQGSEVKELSGILPIISQLQVLILYKLGDEKIIRVTGKEVACLKKLESLKCCFEGLSDFRECMEHLSLSTCNIGIGQFNNSSLMDIMDNVEILEYSGSYESKHSVHLSECCISTEQDFKAFPKDIEALTMQDCSLPEITLFGDSSLSLRCSTKLKYIYLKNCDGIKTLAFLPYPSSNILKSKLPPLQSNGLFSCLKHLDIYCCRGMKRLLPLGLLSTLQNLVIIRVYYCVTMKEIEATKEEDDDEDDDDDDDEREERRKGEQNNSSSLSVKFIRLPKLKKLLLTGLPNLKSRCSGVMMCDSLQEIEIVNCPKLKRIPLSYPLPSLQRFHAYPKEWCESVEWDQLTDKNLLELPVLRFSGL